MALNIVDKTQFPNINAWKAKIEARPAYQRMLAKARPDGMVGALPALPAHAPSGTASGPAIRLSDRTAGAGNRIALEAGP